tara:strand:+ start:592 stop:846 length:255 start_codon:yes stop_codon:yes gene_type:complete
MGKVKEIMMDVEEFVYDFYTPEGVMTESPKVIIEKAIEQFGWSFGSYASEVIEEAQGEMGGSWDWEKSVSQNLVGFEMTDGKIF